MWCAAAILFVTTTACERRPAPPPPVDGLPSTTSQPTDADLAALRGMFPEDRSPGTTPALPAGHPPIPAATGRQPQPEAAPRGAATELRFQPPAEWQPQTPRSSMRKAQYLLPRVADDTEDGELVVFYFGPGEGGGVRDNIERWRSQFTGADGNPLPPAASREEAFEANGLRVTLLDVAGRFTPGPGMGDAAPRDNFRMFAAVIETSGGPWFVRATGPAATMANHWEGVKSFIASATP
jgi:hypothetical protein